ncbi:MAG: hypothetical protein JO363_11415 [Solirubrobacterales bacterium]|nr:hypothetical protein [Solirubrobacterales bacterium]
MLLLLLFGGLPLLVLVLPPLGCGAATTGAGAVELVTGAGAVEVATGAGAA